MIKKSLSLLFTISAMSMVCAWSSAYAAKVPEWRLYTTGRTYEKVWKALPVEIHQEAQDLTGGKGRLRLPIGMAAEDLDNDNHPELIAYVPRDYNLYPEDYKGDVFVVFTINKDGALHPISKFRAFGVMIADSQTEGVKDLMAFTDNETGEYTLLSWNREKNSFFRKSEGVYTPQNSPAR